MKVLNTGVQSENGQVKIIDQDRLCYQVVNERPSSVGLRTISKSIVEEFVCYLRIHPDATPKSIHVALCGSSNIDKFEYGYDSTITTIAKLILENEDNSDFVHRENDASSSASLPSAHSLQQIYYGAPGTGKSFEIDSKTDKNNSCRITFHPDTDYASFVGAYKPTMVKKPVYALIGDEACYARLQENKDFLYESSIAYKFIPQAFLQAYVQAWKWYFEDMDQEVKRPYYLVIEEINRGNCAQIFGDVFQLLDRCGNGFSSYAVTPNIDISQFLLDEKDGFAETPVNGEEVITNDFGKVIATFDDIKTGKSMVLPPNLYIWATMNTSDQSLFPIDSAFKRRWDWKYMPISDAGKNWTIMANENYYSWWEFLQKINALIYEATSSEDKQLGYFFCKPKNGKSIDAETFVGKVIFYLWNDVFKDYDLADQAFYENDTENPLTFDKFYMAVGHRGSIVNEEIVDTFFKNLGLVPVEVEAEAPAEKDYYADGYIFKRIKVKYEGEEIYEETSIDTFVKTIEKIGLDKVASLGLKISNYDLLSRMPLDVNTVGGYGKAQRQLGEYWLITKYSTSAKINYLKKIQKALNLDLEVTIA